MCQWSYEYFLEFWYYVFLWYDWFRNIITKLLLRKTIASQDWAFTLQVTSWTKCLFNIHTLFLFWFVFHNPISILTEWRKANAISELSSSNICFGRKKNRKKYFTRIIITIPYLPFIFKLCPFHSGMLYTRWKFFNFLIFKGNNSNNSLGDCGYLFSLITVNEFNVQREYPSQ